MCTSQATPVTQHTTSHTPSHHKVIGPPPATPPRVIAPWSIARPRPAPPMVLETGDDPSPPRATPSGTHYRQPSHPIRLHQASAPRSPQTQTRITTAPPPRRLQ